MSTSNGISAAAPAARIPGEKGSGRGFTVTAWVILITLSILWLIPSLWAMKTSFTDNGVSALGAPAILEGWNLTTDSYETLLRGGDIWNWYLASFVTGVLTVFLSMLVCTMAAYALSRLEFKGRRWAMLLIVMGVMIPGNVLIVPLFALLNQLSLLGTYWAVILPQVPQVIAVFVFKRFFDGLPKEFEEAARIDGASYWRIFRSVVLPLSRPVIAAMSIVTFVGVWNNLMLPLFVLTNPRLMTIPVGLATVQGSFGQRVSDIQASSILGALPLVILFLIFQRQVVEGVAGSGLKG
ncbi:carbohydrate ABC transporter permease [Aestuariimicrobium ganziense]|uniref:carbohydrate ABC transporter permease n=1 Tax=Aestuariimicrobium ganziense TaxID=2773677 RepID=UPI001941192C|nr:carbohydrate ABC transporter permease [Aestuariimicrobium ganziense]